MAADAREQRRQGRTLIDGPHLIDAYLQSGAVPEMLVLSESGRADHEVSSLLARMPGVEIVVVSDALFREISGVVTPVGVLAVIAIPVLQQEDSANDCILLDAIQDAGNVGTILRTAAAAGVGEVALGMGCAGAWTPRVLRAAQGAHFVLRIVEQADLAELARRPGRNVVAAVAHGGNDLYDLDLVEPTAWLFGNEGAGISAPLLALAGQRATIPLAPGNESLNVAAAAAICLFEGRRQRMKRGNPG